MRERVPLHCPSVHGSHIAQQRLFILSWPLAFSTHSLCSTHLQRSNQVGLHTVLRCLVGRTPGCGVFSDKHLPNLFLTQPFVIPVMNFSVVVCHLCIAYIHIAPILFIWTAKHCVVASTHHNTHTHPWHCFPIKPNIILTALMKHEILSFILALAGI